MEPEEFYTTKIEIIQQCGCTQKMIYINYYDAQVYENYRACIDRYAEDIDAAKCCEDIVLYQQLVSQSDFLLANYLSYVRKERMGVPIIHAVGIKAQRMFYGDVEEINYKIIWKERGTEQYIRDEYPIEI